MRQLTPILVLLAILLFTSSCTVRYSKSLIGSVSIAQYRPLIYESSGFDFNYLVINEPDSARYISFNMMCENAMTQVDYRSNFFNYYLTFLFPKVKVKTLCSE